MAMTAATEDLLRRARSYADENGIITIATLRTHLPDAIGAVMRYSNDTGKRGVYDISGVTVDGPISQASVSRDAPSQTVAEKQVLVAAKATPVEAFSVDIPEIDPSYVPHGCYEVVLKVARSRQFFPVMVVGNSGNGKTFGAEQACARAKRACIIANITNETSEEDLIGSFTLSDGNMIWKDGPVLTAMRRGAVLVLDEIDQATSRILCLQTIMQNRPYYNKKTNEVIAPAPGFTVVGTANTKGDGDGSDMFVGAQIMNSAFLDRFPITVEQEYPGQAVERRILKYYTDNENLISRLIAFGKLARNAYDDGIIPVPITTRKLVHIVQNINLFGTEKKALTFAINRLNPAHRNALIEIYEKLIGDNEVVKFEDDASEESV